MVDYLIDSLGFSKQEAICTSTKILHLKSTKNSQSVIDFLRNYNLSETDVKSIVLSQPSILLRKVDKTLEPKFKILSEIGFSGSDLVSVIKRDPNLLVRGLHTSIMPAIRLLRKILGTNEKILKVIKRSHWPFYGKSFRTNVVLMAKFGVSDKDLERVILRNPRLVNQNPARLEEKLVDVEKEFGIMRGSSMFSYGLSAICSQNKSNLQKKFELFKSFGWCDSDIYAIAKSQPLCFTHSEERLSKGLNFFMAELGCSPSWLATRGSLLMYSLEKRVKPRYQVFKALEEKGVKSKEFHSFLCLSDTDFVKQVVERHKEAIPDDLYDQFTKRS
ncbi:transcription termination factor MTERF5, chloroplastic-like [Cynara cardunculus var. scolymus]|uniref:transcription termination factor MTERF5, chloroplastic-like n=1 Tax=Cynara cardunculus var. scolymus TaxID=59895 RepID=UPI000D628405|nr:transcription termination factor MTERF5, chloroplastic-like [Cynara cardunculus var. scolymus]